MRICLVSREMAPFWGAGIGTYVSSMARAWVQAGHEVHVLGVNDPEALSKGARLFPGVRFHDVDPLAESDDRVLWRSDVAKRSQQVRRALIRLHAAHRFDFIEFPEYFAEGAFSIRGARSLGELAGATLGVRLHSPDRLCRALNADPVLGFNRLLTDRLEMESVAHADAVVSPTSALLEWCRTELRAMGHSMHGPSGVVPYPFDASEFAGARAGWSDPASGRAGHRVPEILYFGRLERRKGVDLLVDAFNGLIGRGVDCTLRMIGGDTRTGPGGGSMREHLVLRLADEARDRVIFEDRLPRDQIVGAVLAASASGGVCCFPSRWENFPNVLIEAMSLGAPVVCADSSGMSEIVQHGHSGLLFRSGDVPALADALFLTLADRSLRERMASNAPAQIRALCDAASIAAQASSIADQGRSHRASRALPSIEADGAPLQEIVLSAPGAWREIERAARRTDASAILVRSVDASVDPRLVSASARILAAEPDVAVVSAFVHGHSPRESWVPLGLDPSALAAIDLSGIGAGAVVRAEAVRAAIPRIEEGLSALGPGAGAEGLSWVFAAGLASLGWKSVTLPEPWVGVRGMQQPYAIVPQQHRTRVVVASMLEHAGSTGHDATRLLASVLGSVSGGG
ncbi:MAG: glycosyltransferase family 4 protein [Phycisphaeraceae bacterium]|nr:glycosyltransferase family 4 protein [Phycisphaeraceae bacterium]